MRLLVTGGAGFIGSHVVDAYFAAGHDVWVLDDLSRGKREHVNPQAHFVQMDIRSSELHNFIADQGFDCVNHHAAQIDVRVSVADPAQDALVNIVGTLNLLEAMRHEGVPMLIFASTGGAIYGEQKCFPASELHPTRPLSPYGAAKLSTEHYLDYYAQVHGLRHVVLRYANVYGPRQDPEGEAGVVAIFCGRILQGQRLTIFGDGEQTRDYVYVGDVARANVLALNYLARQSGRPDNGSYSQDSTDSRDSMSSKDCQLPTGNSFGTLPAASCQLPAVSDRCPVPLKAASCQLPAACFCSTQQTQQTPNVFNIGTGIETSVNALAAMLLEAADTDCPVAHQPARKGEQQRSVIDPALAHQVLGWRPSQCLRAGLGQTLDWFRAQLLTQTSVRSSCGEENRLEIRRNV